MQRIAINAAASVAALMLAFGGLVLPVAAQETHRLHLDTDFGPLTLWVNVGDRSVDGVYPKFEGKVTGHLSKDGTGIHGIWVQAKSDHPCDERKFGTRAWGHFAFQFASQTDQTTTMSGQYGYCDDDPSQPWNGVVE